VAHHGAGDGDFQADLVLAHGHNLVRLGRFSSCAACRCDNLRTG
jgi:hypothetical protein